jgi:hypothetical protein
MRRRPFLIAMGCLGVLFSAGSSAAADRFIDGHVDVAAPGFTNVFVNDHKLYPGTTLTVQLQSGVDVMRRMYNERECWSEWFGGLFCKWVPRSQGSGAGLDAAPISMQLQGPAGLADSTPAPLTDGFDPEPHLPPGTSTIAINLPANIQTGFATGYSIVGRVAPRWGANGGNGPINRTSCASFVDGGTCSQGQDVIHVTGWDTSTRLNALKTYLARSRTAAELVEGGDALDWFMLNELNGDLVGPATANKATIAGWLLDHVQANYRTPTGGQPPQAQADILAIAGSLDPSNHKVQAAIVQNRIDRGLLGEAKALNGGELAALKKAYEAHDTSEGTLSAYAEALRAAGTITAQQYANSDVTAVKEAIGFFSESVKIWTEYRNHGYGDALKDRMGIVQANVDAARTLRLLGGADNIHRAVDALNQARSQLPQDRSGYAVTVTPQGQILTVDATTTIADSPSGPVTVAFAPFGADSVPDSDPAKGVALIRQGTSLLRFEVNPERVTPLAFPPAAVWGRARLGGGGLVGEDMQGHALLSVAADGTSKSITSLVAGLVWDAARDADVTAFGDPATPGAFTLVRAGQPFSIPAAPGAIAGLALSRDGALVALVTHDGAVDHVQVIGTASGAAPQVLMTSDVPTQARLPLDLQVSSDGAYTLLAGATDVTLGDVNAKTWATISAAPTPVRRSFQPTGGHRFARPTGAADGRVASIVELDATSAMGDATNYQLPERQFSNPLGAAVFAIADTRTPSMTILASGVAATIRILDATGAVGTAYSTAEWRPGATVLSGPFMLVNAASSRLVTVVKPDDTAAARSYAAPANQMVEALPLGVDGYGVVYRQGEDVLRVDVYGVASTTVLATIAPPATVGGGPAAWRLLRTRAGPATPATASLDLISKAPGSPAIPPTTGDRAHDDLAYAALGSVATDVLSILPGGQSQTAHLSIRDPGTVIAVAAGTPVQRRRTGLAWPDATGMLHYLDTCTGTDTKCGDQRLFVQGADVMVARRSNGKLYLQGASASASGLDKSKWECTQCALPPNDPAKLKVLYPPGFDAPDFAYASGASTRSILFPSDTLDVIGDGASGWTSRLPFGAPLWLDDHRAIMQVTDERIEIWQNR